MITPFKDARRARPLGCARLRAAFGGGRRCCHPLTACAHSGILVAGTGRRTGFCRSEQRTASTTVRDVVARMVVQMLVLLLVFMLVLLLAQMVVLIGLAGGVSERCFFNRPRH